jgi:hypothetical protein
MSTWKKDSKTEKAKAALGAAQIHQSKKQGYLTKLGGKGIKKNWRQRWFVLDDQNLYYFTDDTVRFYSFPRAFFINSIPFQPFPRS